MSENNLTKYRLAKDLHCAPSTITNWLSGKTPNDLTFSHSADYFDVSVEYLKGETDDRGKKEAPVRQNERNEYIDRRREMLITLFESLPLEDQNDLLFQLLEKAHNQLDRDAQK